MKETEKIVATFADRLNTIKEPISAVVTIHLYTEYWIDLVIKNKTKTANKFLKWSYASKLDLIYNLELIPEKLYQNLLKLNKLRNACAHNLNYDFKELDFTDYNLDPLDNKVRNSELRDVLFQINVIGFVTFAWLNDHARKGLGLEEEPITI